VWAVAAPDAVVCNIEGSRSAEAGRRALAGFKGVVMADGYTVYEPLSREPGRFVLANCWAHVRRKYLEAEHTRSQDRADSRLRPWQDSRPEAGVASK
jgi:hypothetical protein